MVILSVRWLLCHGERPSMVCLIILVTSSYLTWPRTHRLQVLVGPERRSLNQTHLIVWGHDLEGRFAWSLRIVQLCRHSLLSIRLCGCFRRWARELSDRRNRPIVGSVLRTFRVAWTTPLSHWAVLACYYRDVELLTLAVPSRIRWLLQLHALPGRGLLSADSQWLRGEAARAWRRLLLLITADAWTRHDVNISEVFDFIRVH